MEERKQGLRIYQKTSLDEFPQFWNVLNGSMSLSEQDQSSQTNWEQYEIHQAEPELLLSRELLECGR